MEFNDHLYINDGSQIKGACIENLIDDPISPFPNQIWHNSTTNKYKINTSTGVKVIKFEEILIINESLIGDGVNNTFVVSHNLVGDIYIIIKDMINNVFVIDMIEKNFIASTNEIVISFTDIPQTNQYKIYIRNI